MLWFPRFALSLGFVFFVVAFCFCFLKMLLLYGKCTPTMAGALEDSARAKSQKTPRASVSMRTGCSSSALIATELTIDLLKF